MEEKNKIVISTGHEPEEGLETPHFDAEETLLAARPVVPLTEEAIEAWQSSSSARAEVAAPPLAKRIPMLALVIIAAVSVGLASGLAIGLYQGRQKTASATAQSSSATTTTVDPRLKQKPAEEPGKTQLPSVQTVADGNTPTEPVVVAQSESGEIVVPEEVPETKANPKVSDNPEPEREAAIDKKMPDERPAPPPDTKRKKAKDDRADDDGDKKPKMWRRRKAVEPYRDDDVPQRAQRTGQELNRIREIFEGARP
jgi:hypothetical protein